VPSTTIDVWSTGWCTQRGDRRGQQHAEHDGEHGAADHWRALAQHGRHGRDNYRGHESRDELGELGTSFFPGWRWSRDRDFSADHAVPSSTIICPYI
jgi:hypothetical protein